MPTMTAVLLIQTLPALTHDWREIHLLSQRSLAGMYDMYFLFMFILQVLILDTLIQF